MNVSNQVVHLALKILQEHVGFDLPIHESYPTVQMHLCAIPIVGNVENGNQWIERTDLEGIPFGLSKKHKPS